VRAKGGGVEAGHLGAPLHDPRDSPVCGNNVKEGAEQCDGSDATACPGSCQANCTCQAQMCGNNVRDGSVRQCCDRMPTGRT
jgi:hypothetical protein